VSILYRDAEDRDAEALAAFSRDSFVATFGHLYPPEDLASYVAAKYQPALQRGEIADPDVHYRLAFSGDALVGYCKSGPVTLPVEEAGLELHRLYVAETVKGAGVARALMDEALAWMRARGAAAVFLSVWENNARAQNFYRGYGFEHIGEHGFMVGRVRDRDFIWRLGL
jgi:diamine N-acetyltransferase